MSGGAALAVILGLSLGVSWQIFIWIMILQEHHDDQNPDGFSRNLPQILRDAGIPNPDKTAWLYDKTAYDGFEREQRGRRVWFAPTLVMGVALTYVLVRFIHEWDPFVIGMLTFWAATFAGAAARCFVLAIGPHKLPNPHPHPVPLNKIPRTRPPTSGRRRIWPA